MRKKFAIFAQSYNRFGEFISKLRIEKGISLEQLSDGLCDFSLLSRFERGEREPEKLLQNRFLTRLGTVPENYENFLYYKEYCCWEKRQGIIHNILEEHMETAKQLLEEYRQEYDMNYSLEKQFYLAMLAQIRRYEGCEKEELAMLFEEALQLTVPDIDARSFRNRVLSLEELNLLLEYRYCKGKGVSLQFYETLLEYIEKMERTMLAMAKIYPKTVYYYYEAWKSFGDTKEDRSERMLELCDKAIELLRNANRMFYLWELFCMREELIPKLPKEFLQDEKFLSYGKDCREWRETLEELYQEYKVSIAMYEFCYLYVESENYCIGDVIRIRRKMLGLSQEKLSKGICDSRTVSRLERHIRKPQKEIVQQLFDRLNLSTELCRTELVTDSQEAIEKYIELRVLNNKRDFQRIDRIIKELYDMISLEIPVNRQVLLRKEIMCQYIYGLITKEEYFSGIKNALECTIPYKKVIKEGEKYLTNEELSCIQNFILIQEQASDEMKKCSSVLIEYYEKMPYPENYLRMYQYVMAIMASYLGNVGDYATSDIICKKVIGLLLINRRSGGIHEALYTLLWNYEKRCNKQTCIGREKLVYELERCIHIGEITKNINRTQIYVDKRNKILSEVR